VQIVDFYNEAKNAEKAFANFKGHPDYYIPKVHWNLTTDRIMTAEFIHGVKITDVNGMKKLNISPKDAISKTLNALAEQVFEIGFLHADPHPGNIFVRPHPAGSRHGAQVVLLDHGLYKQLSDPVRLQFCRLYKALVLHQLDEIEKACKDMGISSWRMFAMAVLMRPLDPNDLFDDDVPLWQRRELLQSKEKLGAYMQKNMHKKRDEMMEMMKNMPRELLLVFRNKYVHTHVQP
jgi:aarF domain-containing kinase